MDINQKKEWINGLVIYLSPFPWIINSIKKLTHASLIAYLVSLTASNLIEKIYLYILYDRIFNCLPVERYFTNFNPTSADRSYSTTNKILFKKCRGLYPTLYHLYRTFIIQIFLRCCSFFYSPGCQIIRLHRLNKIYTCIVYFSSFLST